MDESKIIIVNKTDRILGYIGRNFLNKKENIYRVSSLWIKNSAGNILLSQRAFSKKHNPGKWGPAVAGTVEKEETYDSNIYKEAKEELGLIGFKFKKGPKFLKRGEYTYFCQSYFVIIDKEINFFKIKNEEIESIKWFSKNNLIKNLDEHPEKFLDNIKDYLVWFG